MESRTDRLQSSLPLILFVFALLYRIGVAGDYKIASRALLKMIIRLVVYRCRNDTRSSARSVYPV